MPQAIVMFQGLSSEIPTGWVLCNGANGTPDLRNRFLIGAGGGFPVDNTGGNASHVHNFTGDGHVHDMSGIGNTNKGVVYGELTDSEAIAGTTDSGTTLPPYYGLFYIMEIS